MYKIIINNSTACTLVNEETGKSYQLSGSFHARSLGGVYKYHEYYVYTNKIDTTKYPELEELKTKAPRTLKYKWHVEAKDATVRDWWQDIKNWAKIRGKRLNEVCEYIDKSSGRGTDFDAIIDLFE